MCFVYTYCIILHTYAVLILYREQYKCHAITSQYACKYTTMAPIILIFAVLYQFSIGECSRLWYPHATNVTRPLERALNKTTCIIKTVPLFNETTLANFTYTLSARVDNTSELLSNSSQIAADIQESQQVDCFGLGKKVATTLEWFFSSKPNGSDALDVQFLLSSRKQPHRVQVVLGEQFGLEWTDFKIERRTVIIVHGFLSHGQETWIRDLEKALLAWVSPLIAISLLNNRSFFMELCTG